MSLRNLIAITLILVLAISLVCISFYPSVQDFMKTNPFWNGLRDFSHRFQGAMLSGLGELEPGPEGNILIAIPYVPYQEEELQQLRDFVAEGGYLLLMDDYGHGNQVLQALGVGMSFAGAPLLDPFYCHRHQWLPLATEFAPELKEAGVETLVLNHATSLTVSRPAQALAWSSDLAFSDANGNSAWDEGEPKGNLAIAAMERLGQGMVVAVSDPSILINSMRGLGDNESFMKALIAMGGENPRLMMDESHITKSPLDRSRDMWTMVQGQLSKPYSQVLMVAMVLALILMPLWRKGDDIEQK
ncbi:MAG TPA: hypothetical protein G4O03_05885 [Dehalococcoidia bacterium]|nr:hypothetical protein [Dehalococcoidia bacterium]